MATNYTGNVTPSLSNAPASSWTDDAAKRSHVGNTYLVTGSGGTAGNVYAFEEYAAPLVKNASGLPADIVTLTDGGEDLPMVKAEVSLSPIQSLNGYDHPWAAGAGKNKFNVAERVVGQTTSGGVAVSDRYVLSNGVVTTNYDLSGYGRTMFSAQRLKAGTYTLSFKWSLTGNGRCAYSVRNMSADPKVDIVGWDATTVSPLSVSFTIQSDADVAISIQPELSAGGTISITDIQIEEGSAATSFAPYENLCPISGHTGAVLNVTGFNICDEVWELGGLNNQNGSPYVATDHIRSKNYIPCLPNTTYYIKSSVDFSAFVIYDANKVCIYASMLTKNVTFTTPANAAFMRLQLPYSYGTTYNNDVSVNYPSTDHEYHSYVGSQYTSSFGQTVYGGAFDFVSGKLVVTWAMIASYNGEILPARWISDRDVYASGATPTTGAQVCYELATPIEIDLDPTEVQTLLGLNNVWASDGQISALTYQSNQFIPKYDWFETWNMPKITRNNGSVIVLPYPKEYTPEIHDVDAATTGRNAAGTMIRDRVATKHKFNYVFPPLSQADATELLAATKDASFTLTTASPETGAKTNYRVYAGDKSLPVYWMPNHDTASWLYSSVSVNLIEM